MVWQSNVELLGYADLEGRSGFKLALQEVAGRFYLYVAALWEPGWSLLDVTEPASPRFLRWLDGPPNTWTIQVQVADRMMITGLDEVPPGWSSSVGQAPAACGFMIWDVSEPDRPELAGQWSSGAAGTHRNFYHGGRYVHVTTGLPGYDGYVYGIVDIADPRSPSLQGTWWYPGQYRAGGEEYSEDDLRRLTTGRPYPSDEEPQHSLSLHGGAYVLGNRAYCPWMRGGLVILDTSNPALPEFISSLPVYPPLGSTIAVHSAVPLPGRNLVVINSEALREDCDEPTGFAGIVDVSNEKDPVLLSLFPQPRPPRESGISGFCAKGGRFGPHNQHQNQGLSCLAPNGDLVYMTYFNAGLQIFDVRNPRDPHIVGYCIPDDPPTRRGPLPRTLVHQAEDVLVDRRGFIYMSEKNSGVYIMKFDDRPAIDRPS
ncbi:MAG TPA: hypothetical protein VMV17_13995 [Streptosporangiaceae bacterium]|nr:hypothetical protein [Streptosporangiaceae bacterium]